MQSEFKKRLYASATDGSSSPLHDILSGTAGGIAQVAVGHPLDTVKVRMQSAGNQGGLIRVLLAGFKAGNLYAGAASPLLGSMVHNATLFYVNGATRNFLRSRDPSIQRPVRDSFISGATVGFSATIVETPVDLLKCKLQATTQYPNVFAAARHLFSQFGIAGLWQGVGATMLRNVPCFSMYFGFNSAAKEYFKARNGPDAKLSLTQMFLGGAAAGLGFWGFLYPLDVVKSRMQVQPSEMEKRKYRNVLHCVKTMWREEGGSIFWRGYSPAIVRALFVNGAVFLAFEVTKNAISVHEP